MATYRKQQRKGALELERIITDLKLVEHKLKAAEKRLMSLRINYPRTDIRPEDPQETYGHLYKPGIFTEPRFWLQGWAFPLSEPARSAGWGRR